MNTPPTAAHPISFTLLAALLLIPAVLPAAEPARSSLPDPFTPDELLWELDLGNHQYTVPRVDAGQIFIGVNDIDIDHPAVRSR